MLRNVYFLPRGSVVELVSRAIKASGITPYLLLNLRALFLVEHFIFEKGVNKTLYQRLCVSAPAKEKNKNILTHDICFLLLLFS